MRDGRLDAPDEQAVRREDANARWQKATADGRRAAGRSRMLRAGLCHSWRRLEPATIPTETPCAFVSLSIPSTRAGTGLIPLRTAPHLTARHSSARRPLAYRHLVAAHGYLQTSIFCADEIASGYDTTISRMDAYRAGCCVDAAYCAGDDKGVAFWDAARWHRLTVPGHYRATQHSESDRLLMQPLILYRHTPFSP